MGFTSAYERLAHRPLLSGKEHLVTATAKLLQQPPDSTCPLGKFYLYLDMEHYNATWNTNQKNLCHFPVWLLATNPLLLVCRVIHVAQKRWRAIRQ